MRKEPTPERFATFLAAFVTGSSPSKLLKEASPWLTLPPMAPATYTPARCDFNADERTNGMN